MIVSVRLLRLRKRLASFYNVSTQVEILTKNRYLSQKVLDPDERMAEPCSSSVSRISDIAVRESNEDPETHLKDGSRSFSHKACPTEDISSPMKLISEKCETSVNVSQLDDKTPVKPISMPVKLMTETPLTSQTVTPGLSARRALLYSPSKSDEEGSSLQKIAACTGEHVDLGSSGRRALASLPDTFDTITFVFGGSNSSSITKQELVHKIISYNLNVEDRREVEEQLSLLEELVPDWICISLVLMIIINFYAFPYPCSISRASDPKSVRARLVEAL
ncbi:unnamed protein product [Spirodela intermedia]|uniref:DNA replication factor Cdt1 C-terminal domain-containing protein n=1 Tax=Spirodela intermedia TaxID=51605 RepID=A0A7I8JM02_SPIIN|nr:unnamed protein product [Spirodela intermedia]CAA6671186.1 unnamed protein product [Spirodela intermedia]